jgi:hypothetical protein
MTDKDFLAIKHDINSSTDNIKILLEMILDGTITKENAEVIKESISRMKLLKENHEQLFNKVKV